MAGTGFCSFNSSRSRVINVEEPIKVMHRRALLSWVNGLLQTEFKRIDELCTGTAYCKLWNILFPGTVDLNSIKIMANTVSDFIDNFSLLQVAFYNNGVNRCVPIERLVKGYVYDNLVFLNWFKHFFDVNYKGNNSSIEAVSSTSSGSAVDETKSRPYSLFAIDIEKENIPHYFYRG